MESLTGKVALITGGGRGIGRASALRLAGAGAAVAVAARTEEQLREVIDEVSEAGGTAIPIVVDVTDDAQCRQMVTRTAQELGPVDILLCNAGGGVADAPLVRTDPDAWRSTVDLNLNSVFYCCHAVLPAMIERGRGSIMVMGSGTGHVPTKGVAAYAAAKAGAAHIVRILAQEVAQYGVDVNEIVPGPVLTQLTQEQFTLGEAPRMAPVERVKTPDEVAELVLYVATRGPQGPTGQVFSLARRLI